MTGIYKITSPSGKIYIGSSINIQNRLKYYSSKNCKGQVKLYNSIIKHGWKNHLVEIIEECDVSLLYEREMFYGKLYDVLGENGLNLILPKNGETKNIGISEITKNKMSLSKSGSKNSFYGKTHSEESKNKIRIAQIGRKHSEEHRLKVSKNSAKIKSKLVLDLYTGIYYESAKEAAFYNNINHSTLKAYLNKSLPSKKLNLIYA